MKPRRPSWELCVSGTRVRCEWTVALQQLVVLNSPWCLCAGDKTKTCANNRDDHVHSPAWLLEALQWPDRVPFVSLATPDLVVDQYKTIMTRYGIDITGLEGERCGCS
jgi:hypothetical protein